MIEMKRYQPHRSWAYRFGYTCGAITARWMRQPTWARTMVYILIGYAIGTQWAAWVS